MAAVFLVVLVFMTYAVSLRGECVFVDHAVIFQNPHLLGLRNLRVSGHISVNDVHRAVLLRDHLGSVPERSQGVAEGAVSRFCV